MPATPRLVALLAAATLATAALATQAHAQVPARTRGTIIALSNNTATLRTAHGSLPVSLAQTVYIGANPAKLSDITEGVFIGTAAVPASNGTLRALEVTIFPESMRGAGEGSYPWDLGHAGSMTNGTVQTQAAASSMTNGTVKTASTAHGLTLTVTYKGGQQTVQIPPGIPVVMLEPGTKALLHPGAKAIVFGPTEAGIVQASRIVIGEHGTTPPM